MKRVISFFTHARDYLENFSREVLPSPPPGRVRLVVSVFIGIYLLWQLVLPAAYYLSEEKFDERFAWRMFSEFGRTQKPCTLDIVQKQRVLAENAQDVRTRHVQLVVGSWAKQLGRNRQAVVDKLLRDRCNQSPSMIAVTVARKCPRDNHYEAMSGELSMNCLTGEVRGSLSGP